MDNAEYDEFLALISPTLHCVRGKVNPWIMCDKNAKSVCILIKLCALVFFKICVKKLPKFHEKILFDSRVINL